jgi:hypothetical protein
MTGLDPVIFIAWLLTGIAPLAKAVRAEMAEPLPDWIINQFGA